MTVGKLKILVPINTGRGADDDGSPVIFSGRSEAALDFALTYSVGQSCEIYLFHVFEGGTKNFRRLDKLNEDIMESMKRTIIAAVDRLHQTGGRTTVEDVHRRMAHGRAGIEILKMAENIDADVIIMGAPNSGAFKKLVTKAPCTIVLLKDKDY